MGALRFIYKNLDDFKARFGFIFVLGIFDGLATFMIPVALAEFTGHALTIYNFKNLVYAIIVLYAASLIFQWFIRRYGESLGPQFSNYVRIKYFKLFEKLPARNIADHHSGYLLSLNNKIADSLSPIIHDIFWVFAKSISNMALFFYFTAKESLSIAFVNLLILIVFIAISTYLARKIVPIADTTNRKEAALLEKYSDFMANISTVKKLGLSNFVESKLLHKTTDVYKQIQKFQNFHSNRWFFLHVIFGIAFLSTIGFLLSRVATGMIPVSVLILFIAAYAVIRGNVERLSESLKSLLEVKAYIRALEKIINPAYSIRKGGLDHRWEEIKFHDVIFKYPETLKKIEIPEFYLKRGEKICVIGKSGEGKTTLLNLVANFFESDGERSIDGISYQELNRDFFSKRVAVIAQEAELFNLSLKENIILGQEIEEKKIKMLLGELDLLDWAENLEAGFDTVVGEKGVKLSAGQKQRINILRGIFLDREIYLLDEPTSHLDSVTERKVIEFLKKYLAGKTAVIVSHREALKEICGRSYVMEDNILRELV
jgi:ABC-type multidrug transport system fused ATPase/permease subunit